MFRVRPATVDDLDPVLAVARLLDTVNLPAERAAIAELLDVSSCSFASPHDQTGKGTMLFVAEYIPDGRIVGTAMILASHGTIDDPHHTLQLDTEERYSSSLGTLFRHTTLRYRQVFTPHTELGGFVVDTALRGHPSRVAKVLGLTRLLYIALHRERFHDQLQAELLPPLQPDGTSLLWEHLGRRFTGMGYAEADQLSRSNREFVNSLFPRDPIYATLLPEHVQQVIGAIGPETQPVAAMLRSVGFRYNGNVDPFDGGPHYAADTDAVHPARTMVRSVCRLNPVAHDAPNDGIVCNTECGAAFRAMGAHVRYATDAVLIDPAVADALGVHDGQPVAAWRWPSRSGQR